MLYPEIVIAGCGNPLFADDGFGPAVIEELQKYALPENVAVVDAGLGGPHFIFTMLDNGVTRRLIIVDCADFGAEPGTLAEFRVEDLPVGTYRDAHSWDLTEPLMRLKDSIDITVIGCQPKHVTSPEMEIGLSDEIQNAIPKTVQHVLGMIGIDYGTAIKCLQEDASTGTSAEACSCSRKS